LSKEATARIKINKLLEEAGWRFFSEDGASANIRLEANVKLNKDDLEALGEKSPHPSTSSGILFSLMAFRTQGIKRM